MWLSSSLAPEVFYLCLVCNSKYKLIKNLLEFILTLLTFYKKLVIAKIFQVLFSARQCARALAYLLFTTRPFTMNHSCAHFRDPETEAKLCFVHNYIVSTWQSWAVGLCLSLLYLANLSAFKVRLKKRQDAITSPLWSHHVKSVPNLVAHDKDPQLTAAVWRSCLCAHSSQPRSYFTVYQPKFWKFMCPQLSQINTVRLSKIFLKTKLFCLKFKNKNLL